MSAASMYDEEYFVVLETNQPEQIIRVDELREKLRSILSTRQDNLPADLQKFPAIEDQLQSLIDTSCEIDMAPGEYLQWYAVRLEK
jgi:hypothetical protein